MEAAGSSLDIQLLAVVTETAVYPGHGPRSVPLAAVDAPFRATIDGMESSDPTAAPTEVADEREPARIRAMYADRDRRPERHPAIVSAYRMVNEDRMRRMHDLVGRLIPGRTPTILDVGCGGGYDLGIWRSLGWPTTDLAGVDLVEARVEAARQANPDVDIRLGDGAHIPFADATFDVATAVTVFSSIRDPALRATVFAEMRRVVRPGGAILVYDFVVRNPRNPAVISMPLSRLERLGAPPTGSVRMTPLLQAVAIGAWLHPRVARLAMPVAPPTHRLSWWIR
jgi:SAM-dependent methyltransferase